MIYLKDPLYCPLLKCLREAMCPKNLVRAELSPDEGGERKEVKEERGGET